MSHRSHNPANSSCSASAACGRALEAIGGVWGERFCVWVVPTALQDAAAQASVVDTKPGFKRAPRGSKQHFMAIG